MFQSHIIIFTDSVYPGLSYKHHCDQSIKCFVCLVLLFLSCVYPVRRQVQTERNKSCTRVTPSPFVCV